MNNPNGLAVDSQGRVWVAEADNYPRRVSVWSAKGKLRTRLLWTDRIRRRRNTRSAETHAVLLQRTGVQARLEDRNRSAGASLRSARIRCCMRTTAITRPIRRFIRCRTEQRPNGRRYFTSCYTHTPTNGDNVAFSGSMVRSKRDSWRHSAMPTRGSAARAGVPRSLAGGNEARGGESTPRSRATFAWTDANRRRPAAA